MELEIVALCVTASPSVGFSFKIAVSKRGGFFASGDLEKIFSDEKFSSTLLETVRQLPNYGGFIRNKGALKLSGEDKETIDLMFEISEKIKVEAGITEVDLAEAEAVEDELEEEDVDA
jgi:hypothetical protein